MTHTISRNLAVGVFLSWALCSPLHADEAMDAKSELTSEIQFGGKAISSEVLADLRGGAETVINEHTLDGVVRDNQAYNLTTGGNLISDGAFAGSSGLATVIQNSGNNVLIQNSTIVNVQLK